MLCTLAFPTPPPSPGASPFFFAHPFAWSVGSSSSGTDILPLVA